MQIDWITAAPLGGLAVDCIVQVAIAHLTKRVSASIAAGVVCGLAATIGLVGYAMTSAPFSEQGGPVWTILVLTYIALAFGYWTFLNLNLTSVRIRIIRELLHRPNGASRAELLQQYSAEEFLQRRLERLHVGSNQFSYSDGRWRLRKRTLLFVALTLRALRMLIIPKRAGQ